MLNLAHVLGFIFIALSLLMAYGTRHVRADQLTGAFLMSLIGIIIGEVLSRL